MKVIPFTIPVSENKTIIIQEDKHPYFYPYLHRHAESQLTLIIKGEGTLVADNNMHPFKSGDMFFIGANQPHIFKSDKTAAHKNLRSNAHSLSIFFDHTRHLSSLTSLPEMNSVKKWLTGSLKGYRITGKYKEKIKAAFLDTCQQQRGPEQIIALIGLLKQLAGAKLNETLGTAIAARFTEAEGSRLNEIYQFSIDNFTANISLEKIASIAHLTVPAFCRYFKKRTGKTYTRFLNELRVSEASRLLIQGHFENISGIAWETGFINISSFNRTFKQINGISPGKFLQRHKEIEK